MVRVEWTPGRQRLGHAEAYLAIGLLVLAVSRVFPVQAAGAIFACPFLGVTGLPCLSCGFTRAFTRMANLDIAGAFSVSPLGATIFLAIVVFCVYALVRLALDLPWPRVRLGRLEGRAVRAAVVLVVLGNWAYLIVRHVVFEDWG